MTNWTTDALFYHIYPLGFCGCETYHQPVQTSRILKIKEWIPHLKKMHINALYLGPVFESYEHGYDTSDYRKIDNRLGSNADFREVCDALHEQGIRIVLDGVFNHVGRYFWAFLDVKEKREQSPYCSWFSNLNFSGNNDCNDGFYYDTWEGHSNLVKLNLKNPEVVNYLLESVGMWMDDFHVDGLRLDAADCIDPDFFKQLKRYCLKKKEDFWLMGEIIHGDYNRWANKDMLDSCTNYECYKGLYSSSNEKNYFEIAYSLNRQFGNGGIYHDLNLYNFVDNHDVNRLAYTLKNEVDLANVYTMLYTMPGIPAIYYGSEFGIKGHKHDGSDQDLRPCLTLDDLYQTANTELFQHIAKLGKIYEQLEALRQGSYQQVIVRNQQYVFVRKSATQTVYAAFNVSDESSDIDFPVTSYVCRDVLHDKTYQCLERHFIYSIPPKSSMILVETDEAIDVVPTKEEVAIKRNELHHEQFKGEQVTCKKQDKQIEEPYSPTKEQHEPQRANPSNDYPALGVYEHFKGKHYALLYIATNSETEEEFAVYRQLYGKEKVWIRPLKMFMENVEYKGELVPRFKYLRP